MQITKMMVICMFMLISVQAWSTEFAVSPMLIDFHSHPGATEPFEISVAGKKPGKIVLSLYSMNQQESGHMSFIESDSNPTQQDAISWIRFERDSYELRKNETTIVRGVIKIPRNGRGTYLAAVMIEEETNPSASHVSIKVRYAVILNINISRPSGRLKTVFDSLILVEREGATHVEGYFTNNNPFMGMLDSEVQIRGQDRRLVARLPLRTESAWQRGDAASRVYPGARVKVVAQLGSEPMSGEYNIIVRNRLSGRSLPVYRQEFAYHSSGSIEVADAEPLQIAPEKIIVSPSRNGISFTPISFRNNLDQAVSIILPAGSDRERGIERFEFIPGRINLRPGMKQRVLLKQMHRRDVDYPGRKFVLAATFESGDQQDLVITTFPGES